MEKFIRVVLFHASVRTKKCICFNKKISVPFAEQSLELRPYRKALTLLFSPTRYDLYSDSASTRAEGYHVFNERFDPLHVSLQAAVAVLH